MFTGIVQTIAEVVECLPNRLVISDPEAWPSDPYQLGESVCIDGCCLTLVKYSDGLEFDLSEETWSRTSFRNFKPGIYVNVERAMRPDDRFGGHIVQGHVDRIGTFVGSTELDGSWDMVFEVSDPKYLIEKGSVTINGVSLTVVDPIENRFHVAVIPHTFSHTTLGKLSPGDPLNIEYDLIAKYVERLVSLR